MPDLTECAGCGALFEEGLFADAGALACPECAAEYCPTCAAQLGVISDCPRCRGGAAAALGGPGVAEGFGPFTLPGAGSR